MAMISKSPYQTYLSYYSAIQTGAAFQTTAFDDAPLEHLVAISYGAYHAKKGYEPSSRSEFDKLINRLNQ